VPIMRRPACAEGSRWRQAEEVLLEEVPVTPAKKRLRQDYCLQEMRSNIWTSSVEEGATALVLLERMPRSFG